MKSWLSPAVRLVAGSLAVAAALGPAAAAGSDGPTGATLADAIAQSKAVFALLTKVGTVQAAQHLMIDPAWKAHGMAAVMVDRAGRVLASSMYPAVVGQNKADLKDAGGKPWVREAIGLAEARREGWIDYQFIDVQTHERVNRMMYVKPWPDGDGFIGIALNRP